MKGLNRKLVTILILLSPLFILSCKTTSKDNFRDNANYYNYGNQYDNYNYGYDNGSQTNVDNYSCYKADRDICEIEAHIFTLTNEFRQNNGKSPFQLNQSVSYSARDWSQSMAGGSGGGLFSGGLSHRGYPEKRMQTIRNISDQIDQGQVTWLSAENVAQNTSKSSNLETARAIVRQWETSSGHRSNMLGSHTYLGVGVAKASGNGSYQKIYATQLFAK